MFRRTTPLNLTKNRNHLTKKKLQTIFPAHIHRTQKWSPSGWDACTTVLFRLRGDVSTTTTSGGGIVTTTQKRHHPHHSEPLGRRHHHHAPPGSYKLYRNKIEIKIHCYTLRHVPGKLLWVAFAGLFLSVGRTGESASSDVVGVRAFRHFYKPSSLSVRGGEMAKGVVLRSFTLLRSWT